MTSHGALHLRGSFTPSACTCRVALGQGRIGTRPLFFFLSGFQHVIVGTFSPAPCLIMPPSGFCPLGFVLPSVTSKVTEVPPYNDGPFRYLQIRGLPSLDVLLHHPGAHQTCVADSLRSPDAASVTREASAGRVLTVRGWPCLSPFCPQGTPAPHGRGISLDISLSIHVSMSCPQLPVPPLQTGPLFPLFCPPLIFIWDYKAQRRPLIFSRLLA